MNEELKTALWRKKAFIGLEDQLLKKAKIFFIVSFASKAAYSDKPLYQEISPSQMSAVGNNLEIALNIEEAKKRITAFILKQCEKLGAKEKRTGKKSSWLVQPLGTGGQDSLGQVLIDWVNNDKYVETSLVEEGIDPLAVLRRFWNNIHGLYRYSRKYGGVMPLEETL